LKGRLFSFAYLEQEGREFDMIREQIRQLIDEVEDLRG
jgi:hypothetical protein